MLKVLKGKNLIHILLTTPLFILLAITLSGCKSNELKKIADSIQNYQQPLDQETVIAGLKQALEISSQNSVSQSSKKGGFSDNSLIRINIPPQLTKVESTLKKLGLGRYVVRFELQMNRAAETASKEALQILFNSISQMTIADGWNILRGENDAATQYFKRTSSSQLRNRFKPVIKQSMEKIGFYKDYKTLLETYESMPFTKKPNLNIETYILQKSLDGLFVLIAEEEEKIRQNPTARVTDLLRKVFSR